MRTRRRDGSARRSWRPTLVAATSVAAATLLLSPLGCISIDVLGDDGDAPLQQSVIIGREGPKILLVEIDGVISGGEAGSGLFGFGVPSMVARVREVLDRASQDPEIRGVLLRIDSPGGSATASEQIYTELSRFRTRLQVPVVAQLLGTAASGGYYVAMAADRVQAHPTTVVGSIGVIFSSMNFAGLMDKLGIEDQTITGGEFKDIGSPYRSLTDEERAQLQSIVDDLHARFREVVDQGRPDLSAERVAELANGRIYSAPQALENGLVDEIGTLEDAVKELARRMGTNRVRVVAYHPPNETRRNLYMSGHPTPPTLGPSPALGAPDLATATLRALLSRPGFHYLWWPGLGAP